MYDFIFKPFNKMTREDYKTIGFKSGLEIHQQLLTEKKLFCRCPAGKYSKNYDAEILRHMRPTLSEMGVYDGTALMEFKTKKNIVYRINRDTVCTYEMDDTPPFLINEQALDFAIGIGLLYDCKVIDELHIARKQYLDGSIPTGFQRTAIYALNGSIPYKDREVKIVQMSIEEDSCREVSDIGHERIYNTDRLGMPLIETVTEPAMRTPNEVAEVAVLCSKLVRSSHKVRRGMGAAREDVNVSVEGGTRIEIKGVSKISLIPLLTYNEAMRQWNLLRLREELKKRNITPETFGSESHDISNVLKKPHYEPLKAAVDEKQKLMCVVLKGFKDLLHWKTQTDTYFSKEISDRVRVIACLTTIPNLIHSDSKGDTITSSDWQRVKKFVNADEKDTLVIVWGSKGDTDTAVKEINIRAKEATMGIPSETRQALSDGTNGFERILPGADRMYPDTDLPPKKITEEKLNEIKSWLPEKLWTRQKWYKGLRIPEDTISDLSISRHAEVFKKAVNELKVNPTTAAVVLIQYPKRLKKLGFNIEQLNGNIFEDIFVNHSKGLIPRDAILSILYNVLQHKLAVKDVIPPPIKKESAEKEIKENLKNFDTGKLYKPENKEKVLMGLVMKKLRGRIPATSVGEIIGLKKGEKKNGK